jgi:hypothetical protein
MSSPCAPLSVVPPPVSFGAPERPEACALVSAPLHPSPPSVRATVNPRWTERDQLVHGGMDPVHGFIR